MGVRIKKNYHQMSPAKFYSLNHRIRRSLAGCPVMPEQLWMSYTSLSDRYEDAYLKASYRGMLEIAERDMLQASLVVVLDEMAAVLEGAAARKPEILLSCGFELTKERRKGTRSKGAASNASTEVQTDNA